MPRDLSDVLHYFLPETDSDSPAPPSEPALEEPCPPTNTRVEQLRKQNSPVRSNRSIPIPLPILGLPIGERDVVRAALAWNLGIETARLGGATVILTPASDSSSPLWPGAGVGPLGTELVFSAATDLENLYATARELAISRVDRTRRGGIVFVRIPPAWLTQAEMETQPIRWLLLLTSSNRRDLAEAHDLTKVVTATNPKAEIGVTIHGVKAIAEARNAFEYLDRLSLQELGLTLASYGLLVDDLHVYRAIAAQRPIGLAHPQAPATRALVDVARLIYEDARSRVLG